jgi:hypothetical protein
MQCSLKTANYLATFTANPPHTDMELDPAPHLDFIDRYVDASPAERRRIERSLRNAPDRGASLEDDLTLAKMMVKAREFESVPLSEDVIEWYVSVTYLGMDRLPVHIRDVVERLQITIEGDPALKLSVDRMLQRMKEIDSRSDAMAQFEALTGRKLSGAQAPALAVTDPGLAAPQPEKPVYRADRPPVERSRNRVLRVGISAALAGAIALAVVTVSRPAYQDLAFNEAVAFESNTRAAGVELPEADAMFLDALTDIREARSSILGLFPRYDQGRLAASTGKLNQVIRSSDDPYLIEQARYFRGTVQMTMGNLNTGCSEMEELGRAQGARAQDADGIFDSACSAQ